MDGQGSALLRQGRRGPGHPGAPGHPRPGCGDRRDHQGYVRRASPSSCARAAGAAGATSTSPPPPVRCPALPRPACPARSHDVVLELKLLADVGLVGFPNVGKSTLLSVVIQGPAQDRQLPLHHPVSQPGRGVCGRGRVASSWPISPASLRAPAEGAGLGHDFLRHIDRCRLLVHVVDVSGSEGRDPIADFDAINAELPPVQPGSGPAAPDRGCQQVRHLRRIPTAGSPVCGRMWRPRATPWWKSPRPPIRGPGSWSGKWPQMLSVLPPVTVYEPDYVPRPAGGGYLRSRWTSSAPTTAPGWWRGRGSSGSWATSTSATTRAGCTSTRPCGSPACSSSWRRWGIQDGDTVSMYDLEFEYQR